MKNDLYCLKVFYNKKLKKTKKTKGKDEIQLFLMTLEVLDLSQPYIMVKEANGQRRLYNILKIYMSYLANLFMIGYLINKYIRLYQEL